MIPLTLLLRQTNAGHQLKGRHEKKNHLLYMDDLKLYGKDEAQIDSVVKSVYTFSTDIGMEFAIGLTKCGVIILKRGKVVKLDGIVLPTGQVMKTIDDEGYKYLGILELDEIMEERTKDKFTNEYYWRLRLF